MFKEIFQIFSFFADGLKIILKFVLFLLLITAPYWITKFIASTFDLNVHLTGVVIASIILLIGLYGCYKIWKMPHLTPSQKWDLMNGRDIK